MSQPVQPRETPKIQLRHPQDSCLPVRHGPGERWGQRGQNLGSVGRGLHYIWLDDWWQQGIQSGPFSEYSLFKWTGRRCLAQRVYIRISHFCRIRNKKWVGTGREEAGFDAAAYYKVTIICCQKSLITMATAERSAGLLSEHYWHACPKLCFIFLKQTAVSCSRGSRDGCRFSLFNERFDRKRPHPRGFRGGARLGKHVASSPAPPSHN